MQRQRQFDNQPRWNHGHRHRRRLSAASLTLLTSSPQIPSDGSANATITALVRDASNNVVAGQAVQFTASSGALVASQPSTTDKNGVVTATLSTAGDPTNQPTITVTGMSGSRSEHRERWRHW